VNVGELEPGAVLAEAVVDDAGTVLLPADGVLDADTISGLVRRDVAQVRVKVLDEQALDAHRRAVSARLEFLFRHAGDNAAARMLLEEVSAYRLGTDNEPSIS
jgi:hypothetical protein